MNQTKDDARATVVRGKFSSLANNPSSEYLLALRGDLYAWIAEVNDALAKQELKEDNEDCRCW